MKDNNGVCLSMPTYTKKRALNQRLWHTKVVALTRDGVGPHALSNDELASAEPADLVSVAHPQAGEGAVARQEATADGVVLCLHKHKGVGMLYRWCKRVIAERKDDQDEDICSW